MRRNWRQSYRVLSSFVVLLWLFSVWLQHETMMRHHEQNTHSFPKSQIMPAERNRPRSPSSPKNGPIEATFNGIPVSFHQESMVPSKVQCTEFDNWRFRSCQYTNLCLDVEQHDFVLVYQDEEQLRELLDWRNSSSVSMGGINPRWDVHSPGDNPSTKGSGKLEWFPRMVKGDAGFYKLPDNLIWVPFHSMAAHNVGHMLWDDLYPMYRLLQTWNLIDSDHQFLLIRQKLPEGDALYASCDIRRNKRLGCKTNFETFLKPIFGVDPSTFSTMSMFQFNRSVDRNLSSSLICASVGVAGIGTLTDHGLADHGWDFNNMGDRVPHNLGHARDFWDFGQWALRNALDNEYVDEQQQTKVLKIVFSLESSKDWDRRLDFVPYRDALKKTLDGKKEVQIEAHRFWELSVEQQLRVTASTSILVATCGGGGVLPVTFLPRGSSMVVFYNPEGGYDYQSGEKRPDWPVRLDWDLLQHAAAHVRVHWFPIRVSGNQLSPVSDNDVNLFVKLIHHELKSANIF